MATKRKKRVQDLPVLRADGAGIDVGASEIFVAVPADRDAEPVRSFATFTRDLNSLADWLHACGIRSAAMEWHNQQKRRPAQPPFRIYVFDSFMRPRGFEPLTFGSGGQKQT